MDKFSEEISLLVGVIVGAVVGVWFQKEIVTWRDRVAYALIGVACGYYLTPPAMAYFGIDASFTAGAGFVVGAFGGSILAAVFKALGNLDLLALVKNRIGGGGQ